MPDVEVKNIIKTYGDKTVVDDVSFSINKGEVFGLIGPNGAGKTTTIRMMMDIIRPDSGSVEIFDEKLGEFAKNRIGYLPEERGLYRKQKVIDTLVYLATLKNLDKKTATTRAEELLERVDMLPHKNKKIEEMSRGMGQLIQFLVTIIHDPQLIILDEPFAGLDPVNTELLKEIIMDLRKQGKALILSTHRMSEVEELCDRILMINNGQVVLYGGLTEIKNQYRNNSVLLEIEGELGGIKGTVKSHDDHKYLEVFLDKDETPQQLLSDLVGRGVMVKRFELSTPSLQEIFLKVVGKNHE